MSGSDSVDNIVDFNNKYKDQLEYRHYGLIITDKDVIKYLDKLFQDLKEEGIEFTFSQIKIKFGASRFYSSLPPTLNEAIEAKINSILKRKEK